MFFSHLNIVLRFMANEMQGRYIIAYFSELSLFPRHFANIMYLISNSMLK